MSTDMKFQLRKNDNAFLERLQNLFVRVRNIISECKGSILHLFSSYSKLCKYETVFLFDFLERLHMKRFKNVIEWMGKH